MLSVDAAFQLICELVSARPPVQVSLYEAVGRVLAEDVVSDRDSPPFDKALMDGYACRSVDVADGKADLRVIEEVTAGHTPTQEVKAGTAIRIMTGAPLPAGADVIVRVEHTEILQESDNEVVRLNTTDMRAERNLLRQGAAMRTGETVLPEGRKLRAVEIGLLAELGRATVKVRPQPRVAVLATGDELQPVGTPLQPGQIHNSNEPMLCALLQAAGAVPVPLGIVRDNRDDLRTAIERGLREDFLILSGGVSAGKLDLVPSELANAGVEQMFHKVHLKPGKPLWCGILKAASREITANSADVPAPIDDCYVFGLPGNPVSSMVCCELFARLAIQRWQGADLTRPQQAVARLACDWQHRSDRPTYHPGWYTKTTDNASNTTEVGTVRPVQWISSADLRATVDANCVIEFPAVNGDYKGGDEVQVILW